MRFALNTSLAGTSVIHRMDARVKLVLLLAYTITLFLVNTWVGLSICIVLCLAACLVAQVPASRLFKLLLPVYIILAFTIIFNSFSFDVTHMNQNYGLGDVSSGLLAEVEPIAFWGNFGFVPAGFARGCFYALRIVFLVFASLVVSFTTSSSNLIDALNDFLKPLRLLRVQTDDIAMMISIALRFIPVTAEELFRIRDAQLSRGASFEEGSIFRRIMAWQPVMIPLFVSLFRRADNLATAMEARCYGLSESRSRLHPQPFTLRSAAILIGGIAFCVSLSIFL